jgi:hypothetical protein
MSICASNLAAGRGPSPDFAPVPPGLADRVTAFMKAWQGKDLSEMYGFYCEPYRQKTPKPSFLSMTRLIRFPILEFKVAGAEVTGDKATVTVWRKSDAVGMPVGQFESESQQVWLRSSDGSWCKEDEPLVLPFPGR